MALSDHFPKECPSRKVVKSDQIASGFTHEGFIHTPGITSFINLEFTIS